jgi:hypothetical protein
MVTMKPASDSRESISAPQDASPPEKPYKSPRTPTGGFLPGFSGNPSGRPSHNSEVRRALKAEVLPSLKRLAEIRDDPKVSAKISMEAAQLLLAYGVGKPREAEPNKEPLEIQEVTAQDLQAELDGLA